MGAAGIALAGCHVGVRVAISTSADGGGIVLTRVTLDREAAAAVPDLASALQVGDLRQAGWTVTGPAPGAAGSEQIEVSKPFANAREAAAAVTELAGPAGPVRNLVIARHPTLLGVSTRMSVDADLSARLEAFADDALRARMGGHAFGVDEAALGAGMPIDRLVSFDVRLVAPGGTTRDVPVDLGRTAHITAASTVHYLRFALEVAGAAVALGAALAMVWWRRREDRARWTIGGGRRRRDRWSVRR